MSSKIVALIPVREGSKRVKNKNFRAFSDEKSLLHLKIRQLKKQSNLDEIYVSSNSKVAEQIAKEESVIFLERDSYMCSKDAKLYEYNTYMLNSIPGNPIVVWAMVTAPLFSNYDSAVRKFMELDKKNFDSLVTIIKYNDFLIDKNGRPINCSFGHWHQLTQELRLTYQITGSAYIALKSDQIEWKYWIGVRPYLFKIRKYESIDIDDLDDFKIAEALYKSKLNRSN